MMASRVASGIVPAVVFPYLPMFIITFSMGKFQTFGGGLDNAAIGLMWNQQIQIGTVEPVALEQRAARLLHFSEPRT